MSQERLLQYVWYVCSSNTIQNKNCIQLLVVLPKDLLHRSRRCMGSLCAVRDTHTYKTSEAPFHISVGKYLLMANGFIPW